MFQPIIPTDGLAGWRFLQRTYDTQLDSFARSAPVQRDTDYFAQKIASVTSAEELVADRRLLTVALGAFGLQDDINNRSSKKEPEALIRWPIGCLIPDIGRWPMPLGLARAMSARWGRTGLPQAC